MNVAEAPEYMAYYGTHVFSNSYEQPSWYMPANDNAEDSGPWYQKDNIVEAMQPCAADRHVSYRSFGCTDTEFAWMQQVQGNTCHICEKTFVRHATLLSHLHVHTKERPYQCKTCGKMFTQSNVLVSHIRIHSGEKPFRCRFCDRSFSQVLYV
ncbi:zinc finger protein 84-like isoform X1 [Ptychodera flava]|uniref:zinc finger protein 84-like isoform X1 n=1 Tax=Ptychodera flava TaxID=63121 RepID=UPI003969EBC0